MATKLDKLLSIRTRIIGDFEHHVTEAKKFDTESNPALVSFRSIALEKSYKEFVDIGEELERVSAFHELENLQGLITKNRAIQDSYLHVKLHLLPLMQNDTSAAGLNASFYDTSHRSFMDPTEKSTTSNQSRSLGIKLPHIQITPFDGKYEDWLEFKETFVSIMKKYNGDNVEKFVHLKTFLRGDALNTIKHLKPKNDSYEAAWELLKDQFENKNAIIEAHLATLMNLPTIVNQFPSTLTQANTTTKSCLAALHTFDILTETWDPMIVFILKQKLGPELRSKWEEKREGSHESATLKEFLQFLDIRHKILISTPQRNNFKPAASEFKQRPTKAFIQTIDDNNTTAHSNQASASDQMQISENENDDVDAVIMYSRNESCGICNNPHRVFLCPKLANDSTESLRLVQEKQLCTNCLYKHSINDCISKGSCKVCGQRHHTLLHGALNSAAMVQLAQPSQIMHIHPGVNKAVLITALVPVFNHFGEKIVLRALVDQGSTANLISERAAQLIRCNRTKIIGIPMLGIGNVHTGTSRFIATFTISSIHEPDFELSTNALISPFITAIRPISQEAIRRWQHLKGLPLADPCYTDCRDIDLLIGNVTYA